MHINTKFLLFSFVVLFFAQGCMTVDPYTGERKVASSTTGSTIGALAGGVIGGLAAKNTTTGVLVGAGIGALAGGGIGNYMDRQESALRVRLRRTGVQVARRGNEIQLIMPGNITFDKSSHHIRSQFYPTLQSVAQVFKQYNRTLVEVQGHTSSTGSHQFNQELSEKRASSVAQYLSAQGIHRNRVVAKGYGKRYPIANNQTARGRELNRRVTISIRPIN